MQKTNDQTSVHSAYGFNVTLDSDVNSIEAASIAERLREVAGVDSVIVSVAEGAGKQLLDASETD